MLRSSCLAFALVLVLGSSSTAQDGIPAGTLATLKRATVFIQSSGTGWKATGSGFVVSVQKDHLLIATNHHVITAPGSDRRPRLTATELVRSLKQVTVSVVFDPGTKNEESVKAEPIAADPDTDLAILRVNRPKDVPTAIDYTTAPKPTETMPVYMFGFPFGQSLATAKGAPAVTVGKGSVSSLRLDDAGNLAMVQLDGALNPGNSGGPVVDARGQLVGVAVATLKNSQSIGFAIPAADLGLMMKGRLGALHHTIVRPANGKITLKVEVEVVDPTAALRGVNLHYLPVAANGTKPARGEALANQTGVKTLTLKVANGVASGEVTLDSAPVELHVQAVPEGGAGATGATTVRNVMQSSTKSDDGAVAEQEPDAKPPAGWKEYTPKDNTYAIWIPAQVKSQQERERFLTVRTQRLKSNVLSLEMANGMGLVSQEIILVNIAAMRNRNELEEAIRDIAVSEAKGRVTAERDVKVGNFSGKEYRIESGRVVNRMRVLVAGNRILVMQVVGTRDMVDTEAARTFFGSLRIITTPRPAMPAPNPGQPANPFGTPLVPTVPDQPGRKTKIQGGFDNQPDFQDETPAGGLLVGLDVGLGKFFNNDIVYAIRPVFRVGDKDVEGSWHGVQKTVKDVVRSVAKPGYAVGAISLKTGLGIDGVSLTFMRVADGKLDTQDNYESQYIGGPGGGGPVKVGGSGKLVVGLIGRSGPEWLTGLGLLYPDTGPPSPAPNPDTRVNPPSVPIPSGRSTKIQGGFNDPEFTDETPPGGLLVGVDVGIGKFVNRPVSHAVRPIYRVGDKDVEGSWHGPTTGKEIVRSLAKPGYAIGALTVKNGLTVDGFSLTYMRIVDGRLDPKDSYESDWLGGRGGGGPVKLGGDGKLVVGLVGKANANALTGLGLLYPASSTESANTTPPMPMFEQPTPITPSRPAPIIPPVNNTPRFEPASTPPVTTPQEAPPEEMSNLPVLLGVAAAGVVLVLAIVGSVLFITKQSDNKRMRRRYDNDDDDDDDDDYNRPFRNRQSRR